MLDILNMQITGWQMNHRRKIVLLTIMVFAALC